MSGQAKRILVTGGAGFIGSAVVRYLLNETGHSVTVIDKLTYAGNLESLPRLGQDPRLQFFQADIVDGARMRELLGVTRPEIVLHLAAESHVDRSIDSAAAFIQTNIAGTYSLLDAALMHWRTLPLAEKEAFRVHHVSTDEVYGSLGPEGLFHETSPYKPNSPYAASKAASDHLVRAWYHTYGLPVIVTNCSNNFGPYQFPEKLIPLMILNCLEGRALPVYGAGDNVRDWLYVEDHARALMLVAESGVIGETYNIGGGAERTNLEVVHAICRLMDEHVPRDGATPHEELITFVSDRPGHDRRYAIDCNRIRNELGWRPTETFESGLTKTVEWYLENRVWWERIRSGLYQGQRLGLV